MKIEFIFIDLFPLNNPDRMEFKTIAILGIIISLVLGSVFLTSYFFGEISNSSTQGDDVEIEVPSLFRIFINQEDVSKIFNNESGHRNVQYLPKSENADLYKEIGITNGNQHTIVIFPIFTAAAYEEPGFYTFFRGQCDSSCLTVPLKNKENYPSRYTSSGGGAQILNILGYKFITDIDVHNNPEILKNYDKIIVLHNEYVTKNEFDAITNHPNVVFFYPNALYAEIEYDNTSQTITLLRGHNYPDQEILNGFDWEFDNTHPYEFDTQCNNWEFYEINNGHMLNCYPEHIIHKDSKLLKKLKEL